MTRAHLSVGLLGLGVVGSEVFRLLQRGDEIASRAGMPVRVERVAVEDRSRPRQVVLPEGILTDDARQVVESPDEALAAAQRRGFAVLARLETMDAVQIVRNVIRVEGAI